MTPARRRPTGSTSRTRFPSFRRAAAAIAATISASLLLSGCLFSAPGTGNGPGNVSTPDASIAAAAPDGLREFYSQEVSWTSCEQGFQCANIKVPVDYAKPDAGSISIAAIRLQSQGTKKGSLLVNPGVLGPQATTSFGMRPRRISPASCVPPSIWLDSIPAESSVRRR